jgi:hypothetical protein
MDGRDVVITGSLVGTRGKDDLRAVIIVAESGRPAFVHVVAVPTIDEARDYLVATITLMKWVCEAMGARVTLPNVKSHDVTQN